MAEETITTNPLLSHIKYGNTTYDFKAAKSEDSIRFNGYIWQDAIREIRNAVNTAAFVVCTNASDTPEGVHWDNQGTTVTGTLNPTDADTNNIYLVPYDSKYLEYITVLNGTERSWVKLGTTDIDISNYVVKNKYQSLGSIWSTTTNETTTPISKTIATGGFNGNQITITPSGTIINYDPTLADNGHSHSFDLHTHGDPQSVIKSITYTDGSISTNNVVSNISSTSDNVAYAEIDATDGNNVTLEISIVKALTSVTGNTTSVVSGVTLPTATWTTTSVAGENSNTRSNTGESNSNISISKGTPTLSLDSITFTPSGDVTINEHTHDIKQHSHNINLKTPTIVNN